MFKTNARALAVALTRVMPLVHFRNTIPILSCVRLQVAGDTLTVSSTDLDMTLDVEVSVEANGWVGAVALSPRPLLAILKLLPRTDAVEITVEADHAVVVTWNGGRARLPGMYHGDFPVFTMGELIAIGKFDDHARDALRRVVPCVSNEETRYYLNGVCIDQSNGRSCFVATDGHRMAVMPAGAAIDEATKDMGGARPIIPREAVHLWLRLAEAGDLTFRLFGLGNLPRHIEIEGDGVRFRSKVIDGAYPPWERVIPKLENRTPVRLRRADLIRACSLARFGGKSAMRSAVLTVKDGRAQLTIKNHEVGAIAIDLCAAEGDVTLGLNAAYLADAMAIVRGKWVTITPGSEFESIPIVGDDAEPGEHIIIMPMRDPRTPEFSAPAYSEGE